MRHLGCIWYINHSKHNESDDVKRKYDDVVDIVCIPKHNNMYT